MKKDSIFYWKIATVISFLIAILSLCLVWLRVEPIEFEMLGIFATILTGLVTLLIGWNIYNIIDIKRIRKDVKKERKKYKLENFSKLALLHIEIAKTYMSTDTVNAKFQTRLNILKAILNAQKSEHHDTYIFVNEELSNIRLGLIKFTKNYQEEINKIKYQINMKKLKEVGNFDAIIDFIQSLYA